MSRDREPIAVIGLACRFPGAPSAEGYWRLLRAGEDAISEVPPDRWNIEDYYHPRAGIPGKMVTRWGAFLDAIDRFDAEFFGISPREAMRLDPQQRLLLEIAWETFEDAGIAAPVLRGSETGVFVGISSNDYWRAVMASETGDTYLATGNASSIASNRISYFFDLAGPSVSIDTACSSALVAVHFACRSLWEGDATMALAGGVNAILSPVSSVSFSQAGMLSPDGRCHAFDASANGYVRGEGCGLVLLKRLSRAEADGDRIYALIRGTATNQDGHTSGLTVPSQAAQEAVILEACREARVEPGDVDYVEAHGTGTPVGDPIEARALGRAFSKGRAKDRPLVIGSCKTNIGHLESAAGVAGIIKAVLCLNHGEIPASLNFREPNPGIQLDALGLRIATECMPWPRREGPGLAGVNSFGFGGANAHAVLERYEPAPSPARPEGRTCLRDVELVAVSAQRPEALRELASRWGDFLADEAVDGSLAEVAYTAGALRAHHDHRLAIVARSRDELVEALRAHGREESRPGTSTGRPLESRGLVFVFTGQGPQWWAMGRQLFSLSPVYRDAIERCDEAFRRLADWSILDALRAEESTSRLQETAVAQPCLFALQVGLARLWSALGVTPDAVVGHSVGEVAALHVAGALGLEASVEVIYHRSRLMQRATGKGRMAAVDLSAEEIGPYLAEQSGVDLAAANAPESVVLSGEVDALEELLERLQDKGVFYRYLPVDYAFHSAQMEPYIAELGESLGTLATRPPVLPVYSTVTGGLSETEDFGSRYWTANLRQTVRFRDAVQALVGDGYRRFLEIGPHPTLTSAVTQGLAAAGQTGTAVASLRRGEDDDRAVMKALGSLYASGHPVDWEKLHPEGPRRVGLPHYAWQRERHWIGGAPEPQGERVDYALGGRRVDVSQPTFRVDLGKRRLEYLRDHRVQRNPIVPAAAYVEMALAGAAVTHGPLARVLTDIDFRNALALPDSDEISYPRVEVVLQPGAADALSFRILSRRGGEGEDDPAWRLHAEGTLQLLDAAAASAGSEAPLEELRARVTESVPVDELYERLAQSGLDYGPCFRGVSALWRGRGEALARLSLPAPLEDGSASYLVHPSLLDAALQSLAAATDPGGAGLYLPIGIERVRLYDRVPPSAWAHARVREGSLGRGGVAEADVVLMDDDGRVLVSVSGLRLSPVDGVSAVSRPLEELGFDVLWELRPRPGRSRAFASPESLASPVELARRIEQLRDPIARRRDLDRFDRALGDELADAYIVEALRELGWPESHDGAWTLEQIEAHLGIVSRHRLLLQRFLRRLEASGRVQSVNGRFQHLRSGASSSTLRKRILARDPLFRAELDLMEAAGSRLGDVLRGAVDPLEVLFPEGSLERVERYYHDSAMFWVYNRLLAEAVSTAVGKLPPDRVARILEVGAGTGATTSQVLSLVPTNRVEYVFTDVSPAFLAGAQARFGELPFLRTSVLDLEKDPERQGFEPQSFDVILAPSVLHATADLRVVLAHLRRLLSDRGLLIVLEVTGSLPLSDIVFAQTEGWWRFTDSDLRPQDPLLSAERWVALLGEMGFSEAVAAPRESIGRSDLSIVIARGPAVDRPPRTLVPPVSQVSETTWLVFADDDEGPVPFAERLSACGLRSVRVRSGPAYEERADGSFVVDPTCADDFRKVLARAASQDGAELGGILYHFHPAASSLERDGEAELGAEVDRCLGGAMHLAQAIAALDGTAPRLFFVSHAVASLDDEALPAAVIEAGLSAFTRVLANEHPELRVTSVDLSVEPSPEELASLMEELGVDDGERDIALRGPSRYVRRLVRHVPQPVSVRRGDSPKLDFALEVARPGRLDTIAFTETRVTPPGRGEVEIEVEASALNFLDVLFAMGLYPGQAAREAVRGLGMECAGVVSAVGEGVETLRPGDAVIALAPGSYASRVVTRQELVARKPEAMTFEQAATLPVAFLTAHYALGLHGRLGQGERLLVHSASGGVGLAAVQLARLRGAEILATAGSEAKRDYLAALGIEHVMDSRSLRFRDEIERITGGEGVDVVLNSLPGEALVASLGLLRPNGRFLEIGKRDIYENRPLGMRALKNNVSFSAIDLIPVSQREPELLGELLRETVALAAEGRLEPLPYVSFPFGEAEQAFRYMAQAKHIGKVMLTVGEDAVPVRSRKGAGAFSCRADGTYLVTGGLGGFGLLLAEWLVERGARHLVLLGRSAPEEAALATLARLREQGARVTAVSADVSRAEDVARVLSRVREEMPVLRGVFHAAMVLDDVAFRHLTLERLQRVMAPKLAGAWNLHRATRALDIDLDLFVLFSSAAGVVGTPGQASYVAANACLDTLVHHRRRLGLEATTVIWGGIGDVGYVSRNEQSRKFLESIGVRTIPGRTALEALGVLLSEGDPERAIVDADWSRARRLLKVPTLSKLGSADGGEASAGTETSVRSQLLETPPAERHAVLMSHLRQQLSRILQLEVSRIPIDKPLTSMGLDSLMAYELKGRIESDIGVQLPMMKLVEGPSLSALAEALLGELAVEHEPVVPKGRASEPEPEPEGEGSPEVDAESLVRGLDHLSDEQVDSMLKDLAAREAGASGETSR